LTVTVMAKRGYKNSAKLQTQPGLSSLDLLSVVCFIQLLVSLM